jgi:hypothetical protein
MEKTAGSASDLKRQAEASAALAASAASASEHPAEDQEIRQCREVKRKKKRSESVSSSSPDSDSSDTEREKKRRKRKEKKHRKKRDKKKRKKEKKRKQDEHDETKRSDVSQGSAPSMQQRVPTTASSPHTSLLSFMQPLTTGYSADRQHAMASVYKTWDGKNDYDKKLEQNYQHSWGSAKGTETKLERVLREEEQAERQKKRSRS